MNHHARAERTFGWLAIAIGLGVQSQGCKEPEPSPPSGPVAAEGTASVKASKQTKPVGSLGPGACPVGAHLTTVLSGAIDKPISWKTDGLICNSVSAKGAPQWTTELESSADGMRMWFIIKGLTKGQSGKATATVFVERDKTIYSAPNCAIDVTEHGSLGVSGIEEVFKVTASGTCPAPARFQSGKDRAGEVTVAPFSFVGVSRWWK